MNPITNIVEYPLGNQKYLTLNDYNDQLYIHIRQYIVYNGDKKYPSSTGIAITPLRFASFVDKMELIDTGDECVHIGGRLFAFAGEKDIRLGYGYRRDGKVVCGKRGIALSQAEWIALKNAIGELMKIDDLRNIVPCYINHAFDTSITNCQECYPFNINQMEIADRVIKPLAEEQTERVNQTTTLQDDETPINAEQTREKTKRPRLNIVQSKPKFERQNATIDLVN